MTASTYPTIESGLFGASGDLPAAINSAHHNSGFPSAVPPDRKQLNKELNRLDQGMNYLLQGFPEFQVGQDYAIGRLITDGSKIYKSLLTQTAVAGDLTNITKWELLSDLETPASISVGATGKFTSVNDALDFLSKRTLTKSVTISLLPDYSGVEPGTVTINHPQSSMITIAGIASGTTASPSNVIACTSVTGAIGNLSVTYTLSAAIAGLAVGDYVIIDNETATDNQLTMFLGSHCGTWRVTAVSGTTVTVNNIQPMHTTLTNAHFANARMTKCSLAKEGVKFDNCEGLTIGNVIFAHVLNKPVADSSGNSSIVIDGFLGFGSQSTTANTGAAISLMNCDIGSVDYNISASNSWVLGAKSVLSIAGVYSQFIGRWSQINSGSISLETLITGTKEVLINGSELNCYDVIGGFNSTTSGVSIYRNACNNNAGSGVLVGSGSVSIGTQTACNNNAGSGVLVGSGSVNIGTQTACNNNAGRGVSVGSGSVYIGIQDGCSGNSTDLATHIGKVYIDNGAANFATQTKAIYIAGGRGSICKGSQQAFNLVA